VFWDVLSWVWEEVELPVLLVVLVCVLEEVELPQAAREIARDRDNAVAKTFLMMLFFFMFRSSIFCF
jgi:hypothetical protein